MAAVFHTQTQTHRHTRKKKETTHRDRVHESLSRMEASPQVGGARGGRRRRFGHGRVDGQQTAQTQPRSVQRHFVCVCAGA